VDVGGPDQWVVGVLCAEFGDGVVQGVRGVGAVRVAAGGEPGVDGVGDLRGGGVGDPPQGGDDVPVPDQLQGTGQMQRLVGELVAAGGGFAGGQERQVGVRGVQVIQLGDR